MNANRLPSAERLGRFSNRGVAMAATGGDTAGAPAAGRSTLQMLPSEKLRT